MLVAVWVYGCWLSPAVLLALAVLVGFELDWRIAAFRVRRRAGRRGGFIDG